METILKLNFLLIPSNYNAVLLVPRANPIGTFCEDCGIVSL